MPGEELCSIVNKTKGKHPRLPFDVIKNKIVGSSYDLSICFVSPSTQKKLNTLYRKKNTTTNVLSFSLSKTSGEITFDLAKVKDDASLFSMTYSHFLKYLFIHGLLHLKGYEHSSTMEREEKKFLTLFS